MSSSSYYDIYDFFPHPLLQHVHPVTLQRTAGMRQQFNQGLFQGHSATTALQLKKPANWKWSTPCPWTQNKTGESRCHLVMPAEWIQNPGRQNKSSHRAVGCDGFLQLWAWAVQDGWKQSIKCTQWIKIEPIMSVVCGQKINVMWKTQKRKSSEENSHLSISLSQATVSALGGPSSMSRGNQCLTYN